MASDRLFTPLTVGRVHLAHRIVMAPLTRFRADDNHVPTSMAVEYYSQRASVPGTLLITEATYISPEAVGYPNAPGVWTQEQIEAWKRITSAVHQKGSHIFLQLWAVGRVAGPKLLESRGYEVVSSSATPVPGPLRFSEDPTPAVPHALTEREIWRFVSMYAEAAKNAIAAGFDGVEIHGGSGYLIDQFTQDTCNVRTDQWGGSVENRSRFAIEVAAGVVRAIGSDRTAFRITPFNTFQGMGMDNASAQYRDLVSRLNVLKLAYLHIVGSGRDALSSSPTESLDIFVELWSKTSPVFLNGGFTPETARNTVDSSLASREVAIAFGRSFISNPDLVYRVRKTLLYKLANQAHTTFRR